MTFSRRDFLSTLGRTAPAAWLAAGGSAQVRELAEELARFTGDPDEIARDERFWAPVQQAFTVDRSIINLNNAGVSPSPALVQDAMKRHLDYSNEAPVQTMWRVLEPQRETVRAGLARMFGCDAEEVAITRNATEALQILQMGFDLRRGGRGGDLHLPRSSARIEQRFPKPEVTGSRYLIHHSLLTSEIHLSRVPGRVA
ncbi:MAG TPA: hypothetical protein VF092_08285 [Longimicrobium sp.]